MPAAWLYEVLLEVLDLVVREHHLRELSDSGVHAVHDLVRVDLALEHRPAVADALLRLRRELDLFTTPSDCDDVLDRHPGPVGSHRHRNVLVSAHLRRVQP